MHQLGCLLIGATPCLPLCVDIRSPCRPLLTPQRHAAAPQIHSVLPSVGYISAVARHRNLVRHETLQEALNLDLKP